MVTIGEFARLAGTSVRTLHHYDSIGLLRPARVDMDTGYRHYEAAQLGRLNRILALKDLGFSLAEVSVMVEESVPVSEIRGMLRLRRAELRSELTASQQRLDRVEGRLRAIEQERSGTDARLVEVPAQSSMSLSAPVAELSPAAVEPVLGPLFAELGRRLAAAGVRTDRPRFAMYQTLTDADHVLVHACQPVDVDLSAPSLDLERRDLAGGTWAASLLAEGPPADISWRWQQLASWVETSGYVCGAEPREIYHNTSGQLDTWRIELQQPLIGVPPTLACEGVS